MYITIILFNVAVVQKRRPSVFGNVSKSMTFVSFLSGWPNVALQKPATQSSDAPRRGRPQMAVDGSRYYANVGECTHTLGPPADPKPWWRVDLQEDYDIYTVVVTSRGDCCGQSTCMHILIDLFIYIYIQLYGTRYIQTETRLKTVKRL